MSSQDKIFRRNFVVAAIMHVVVIAGIVVWEEFLPHGPVNTSASVELVVPADILGELPVGPGSGKGMYAPPPPQPEPVQAPAGPSERTFTPDESAAPAREVALPRNDPNEIKIPTKKPVKQPPVKPTTAKVTETVKAVPTPTKTKSTPSTGTSTGTAKGPTADQIRQHFLSAMRSSGSGDGTPYGDNRPAGGGSGKSKAIGSPNGSVNGVAGGIGAGSPFWEYYQHVHDKMYHAWEQPGSVTDRKLMSVVMLKVGRDGSVMDVSLKRSSGNRVMDDSALSAARKVQMLQPPPDALVRDSAANISVEFQMEG
jgi:TonB family protein